MTEPAWGEPPIPDVVARLLRERWDVPSGDILQVSVEPEHQALRVELASGAVQYRLRLRYRSGRGDRDPWMVLVDALDALFGQFEESGRDHRSLPSGEGVEFQGAMLAVELSREVPELQRMANRLLSES